jgi:hypothetical protein
MLVEQFDVPAFDAAAFEGEAVNRGALTVTLGTDDDSDMTSLSGVDLYLDLPGVMPDANGLGRPHIYLSIRIFRPR